MEIICGVTEIFPASSQPKLRLNFPPHFPHRTALNWAKCAYDRNIALIAQSNFKRLGERISSAGKQVPVA